MSELLGKEYRYLIAFRRNWVGAPGLDSETWFGSLRSI
jgi:hypothetical protein